MKSYKGIINLNLTELEIKPLIVLKQTALLLIFLIFTAPSLNAEIPERPRPPRLVNDFAEVLSRGEIENLESKLVQFAKETSTQIVIVTVSDLEGYDPGDYAFRLGEQWGVGQKGSDNGLVILVKPKIRNEQGRIFIATGYGLEGILPDATVNGTIIDAEIIPHFKQNNYYQGLENGTNVIMDITRGEYTAQYYNENYTNQGGGIFPVLFILFLIFVIFPILRGRRRRYYSPGKSLPFWLALGMLSGGRSHPGSFGNFSSGRGGFGGFGGGSFGGGGAGGSW